VGEVRGRDKAGSVITSEEEASSFETDGSGALSEGVDWAAFEELGFELMVLRTDNPNRER